MSESKEKASYPIPEGNYHISQHSDHYTPLVSKYLKLSFISNYMVGLPQENKKTKKTVEESAEEMDSEWEIVVGSTDKVDDEAANELWQKIIECLEKIQTRHHYGDKDSILNENLENIKKHSLQLKKFTVSEHLKESFETDLVTYKLENLKAYVQKRQSDEQALHTLESVVNTIKYKQSYTHIISL